MVCRRCPYAVENACGTQRSAHRMDGVKRNTWNKCSHWIFSRRSLAFGVAHWLTGSGSLALALVWSSDYYHYYAHYYLFIFCVASSLALSLSFIEHLKWTLSTFSHWLVNGWMNELINHQRVRFNVNAENRRKRAIKIFSPHRETNRVHCSRSNISFMVFTFFHWWPSLMVCLLA